MNHKKAILGTILLLTLTGCSRTMDYVIGHEPHFVGIVNSMSDDYVSVSVNADDPLYADYSNVMASLDVELHDSFLMLSNGDEIVVYYDGNLTEGRAETVYAITLRTPAVRETE